MARIIKGDKVLVIAGKDRNKVGVVERVFPQKNKVVITGINVIKKHQKKSMQNPQGGILEKIAPIQISNVMLLDSSGKPSRIGYKVSAKDKIRVSLTNSETIRQEKAK